MFLLSVADGYRLGVRKTGGCRRDARTDRQLHALIEKDPLQHVEEEKHIGALAGIPHQADAPRRGLDLPKASRDFNIEVIQQAGARFCAVDAAREYTRK